MSVFDLRTFFRLAHEHYDALMAVYDAPHGLREAEIREQLTQSSRQVKTSIEYAFQQLQEHGLIQPVPGETSSYEVTHRLETLIREFRREQALTTPKAIQAHLEQVTNLTQRLRERVTDENVHGTHLTLTSINDEVESIRTLSRTNREAVLHRITDVRAADTKQTVTQRFEIISDLMDDHIEPLVQIVETQGTFEGRFRQLRRVLALADRTFSAHPSLPREIRSTGARLRRARTDVLINFEIARDEVQPLFERQRRDASIVRGASRLLKIAHHEGPDALRLPEKMRLTRFTIRTALSDGPMRSFLLRMRDYTPPAPPPIRPPATDRSPIVLDRDTVIQQIRDAAPVDDALDWILTAFDGLSKRSVLTAYRHVLQSEELRLSFETNVHRYRHDHHVFAAHPVRVDIAPTEDD